MLMLPTTTKLIVDAIKQNANTRFVVVETVPTGVKVSDEKGRTVWFTAGCDEGDAALLVDMFREVGLDARIKP